MNFFALLALMAAIGGYWGYWENWEKTESVSPMIMSQPSNAAQLTSWVGKVSAAGLRVRMTGSGHSASDVAITKEVLFTPERLNQPLTLDRTRLKNPNEAGLMRVMSGIKVADLNEHLNRNGRALFNMGGYDGQTIAGVMMTATHGSGLAYGPIADQVASLQMVVDGGRMVQIEPANGITNPATFKGTLEEDANIRVQLIQDDDAFNAARVSVGSMGIVYSVVLRTDQKFWLREVRHQISWTELSKPGGYLDRAIAGLPIYGDNAPSPEHWELQYSPYKNETGDHTFLITDRYRSYAPLPEQAATERGQPGTEFGSGLIAVFGLPLAQILDLFPELAKQSLELALDSQVDDNYTNVSYKVFNIGVVNYAPAVAIEAAFHTSQIKAAIERSFSLGDALFAQGAKSTSPIAVRFVKPTTTLIGMQQGRPTAFMEVIALRGSDNAPKLLKAYQQTMLAEFGARPHWGLDLNLLTSETQARALYPQTWDRWKTQYRRFNVTGTFDGKVTDRLGISVRPRT